MYFEPGNLEGKETGAILDRLIQYVTKSDEEIAEEGREKKKTTTELKVFLAENRGLEQGDIEERIENLLFTDGLTKPQTEFFDSHNFEEYILNEELSSVEITTPQYDRTDQFFFYYPDNYLRVFTVERRKWTERTVERLIKYLPELDRLLLSSEDLEEISEDLQKTDVSGFTAKYQPYYREQSVSIQFHGSEPGDLEKVEEEFNARPSRLELSRRNSPADAVKTSMDVGGYFSVPRIREDSQELGHETLMQLGEEYQSRDRENFDVEQKPRKIPQRQGFSVEGHTTLELVEQVDDLEPDVAPSHEGLVQKLEEEVIDGKRRYEYSVWEDGNYMVFDKERDEPFEITIEDRNIVLHAKPATSSVTLRDFCDIIRQEFNTTYRLEKTSEKVGVL